jgi:hypothetical protein
MNKNAFSPTLAFISIGVVLLLFGCNGMGKAATYDMYPSCKDASQDCTKSKVSVTFKVDKEKSQVIQISTVAKKIRDIRKLDNCIVIDEHNWQCTDNPTSSNPAIDGYWSSDTPFKRIMTEDEMTMSDSTLTQFVLGKTTTLTFYGPTFVKR